MALELTLILKFLKWLGFYAAETAADKAVEHAVDAAIDHKSNLSKQKQLADIQQTVHENYTLLSALANESNTIVRDAASELKPLIETLHVVSAHDVLDNLRKKVRKGDRETLSHIDYYRGCCSRYVDVTSCKAEFDLAFQEMIEAGGYVPEIIGGKICAHCLRKDQYHATLAADKLKEVSLHSLWAWVPDLLFSKDMKEAYLSLPDNIDRQLVIATIFCLWNDDSVRFQCVGLSKPIVPDALTFENIPLWLLVQFALLQDYLKEWNHDAFMFNTEAGEACQSFFEASSRFLSLVGKTEIGKLGETFRLYNLAAGYKIKKDPTVLTELMNCACSSEALEFKQLAITRYLIDEERYDDAKSYLSKPDIVLTKNLFCYRFYIACITEDLDFTRETLELLVEKDIEMPVDLLVYYLLVLVSNYDSLKDVACKVGVEGEIHAKAYHELLNALGSEKIDTQFLLNNQQQMESSFRPFVAIALNNAGLIDQSLDLCESCISADHIDGKSSIYYSLLKESHSNARLSAFLKSVRENGYAENQYWLKDEYDLASEEEDYPRMLEIVSALHKLDPKNPSIFVNLLWLQYQNGAFDKVKEQSVHLADFHIGADQVPLVFEVLKMSGFMEDAIDFLYNSIQSLPFNEDLNLLFHTACLNQQMAQIVNKEYEWVDEGLFVYYKHNGSLTSDIIMPGRRTTIMIGKKPGETTYFPNTMGGSDCFEIVSIHNKYFKLYKEINDDISDNKYQSVFSVSISDMGPDRLLSYLEKVWGQGAYQQKLLDNWKNNAVFGTIFNQDDSVAEYYNLLFGDTRIYSIQTCDFEYLYKIRNIDIHQQEFVLDLSAVILLYELHLKFGFTYPFTMIVPQSLVHHIEKSLESEEITPDMRIQQSVTDLLAQTDAKDGETWYRSRVKGLLAWVTDFMKVVPLEKINDLAIDDGFNIVQWGTSDSPQSREDHYCFHCMCLASQYGRVLVSEDMSETLIMGRFMPVSDVSCLISVFCSDHSNQVSEFFLRSNIYGGNIDAGFVYSQYEKYERGEMSLFQQCRENLTYCSFLFPETLAFCDCLYNKVLFTNADALVMDGLLTAVFKQFDRDFSTKILAAALEQYPQMKQALVSAYQRVFPILL